MTIVVDIKVFILLTCLKTLIQYGLMVNSTVDGKVNHKEETMEVSDVIITSIRIIGLLLLLAGVLLLLLHLEDGVHLLSLHLDDVMNLGAVKHI